MRRRGDEMEGDWMRKHDRHAEMHKHRAVQYGDVETCSCGAARTVTNEEGRITKGPWVPRILGAKEETPSERQV